MKSNLSKIYFLISKFKLRVYFLIFLILCASILELISIGIFVPGIILVTNPSKLKSFIPEEINFINNLDINSLFIIFLSGLVFIFLIKLIFFIILYSYKNNLLLKINNNLSSRLLKSYLLKNYYFFVQNNSSKLTNLVFETISFVMGIVNPILVILTDTVIFIFIFALLINIEPSGTIIISCIIFLLGFIFYFFTKKKLSIYGENKLNLGQERLKFFNEMFNSIKEIKIFNLEKNYIDKHKFIENEYTKIFFKEDLIKQLPKLLFELFLILFFSCFTFLLIIRGLDVADITLKLGIFTIAAVKIVPIANRIIISFQSLKLRNILLNRIYKDVFESENARGKIHTKENVSSIDNITISNFSYRYPESKNLIFENTSIELKKGNIYALTGDSGTGKSTLVDLISGLLKINSGEYKVNHINFKDEYPTIKMNLGYVTQSTSLIDDSLKKNICMDLKLFDPKKYLKAIEVSQLSDFINSLSDGDKTPLGEKGTKISGGQKQRIGIARSIYKEPSILIFDESTNALDKNSEDKIFEKIAKIKKDKIMIIISHNDNILKFCDIIYNIQNKKIIQR